MKIENPNEFSGGMLFQLLPLIQFEIYELKS